MFLWKMLLRNKLFFYGNKCRSLSKFSVKPFLSTRTTVLHLRRCTATVGCPSEVTGPQLQNLHEFRRPYFMQYLLDNAHKYCVVNTEEINVEDETNFQSLKLLKSFLDNSQDTEISDDLLDSLNEEFEICGVEEICKLITLFANYSNSKKILKPLSLFNETLLKRNLSDEETLKILWVIKENQYKSVQRIQFRYFIKAVMKLFYKIHRLNSKQVAQLFLHLPKFHPEFLRKVKFPVQMKLVETIPELNAEEFGIVADGFSRAGLPLSHPELPSVITNKAIKEIENLHDLLLNKISKLLECNLRHQHSKYLMEFQEKIIPHVSKFSEGTLVHLILSSTQLRCIHPSLWEIAADIFKKNMENLNINQIERLLYATTIYNIQDEELLNVAVKHFKEKIDIKYYGTLVKFLCHLVHHQLYPEDLLHLIFSECFVSQVDLELLSADLKYKYSFLNCCVEVERPEYNLYLLNEEQRKILFRAFKFKGFSNELLNKCRNSMKRIMNVLEDLFGKDTVCEANCLPHYESGIVMKFDRNLKAQILESRYESYCYAKEAMNDNDVISLFIMVLPMNNFSSDEVTPILSTQTQIRQLRSLGYNPVMVKNIEWVQQVRERNEFNFMKELILKNLEDLLQEKEK